MAAGDLVLIHGFAGTGRAWDPVRERLRGTYRAPDVRGHGAAGAARPISLDTCARDVLAAGRGPLTLCGYSQGGRIALHAALAAPERVARLVLVATTAGIEDDAERAARRDADEQLARFAETATAEQFADRWAAQPLFAGTPPEAARVWREDILRSDPRDLAAVLRGIGTGQMAPLWDRLGELTMRATVVVGERDAKFLALGERLAVALPDARLVVIPGAGHGIPREAPAELAALLNAEAG